MWKISGWNSEESNWQWYDKSCGIGQGTWKPCICRDREIWNGPPNEFLSSKNIFRKNKKKRGRGAATLSKEKSASGGLKWKSEFSWKPAASIVKTDVFATFRWKPHKEIFSMASFSTEGIGLSCHMGATFSKKVQNFKIKYLKFQESKRKRSTPDFRKN